MEDTHRLEEGENECLISRQRQRHEQPQNNLREKILKGSFYVLTFSIAVLALTTSFITVILQSQSDKIPVKYTTYERIGNKGCPKNPGTTMIYSGVTVSYSFYNNTPTSYAGFRCMPTDDEDINYSPGTFKYDEYQVYSGNVTEYITFADTNHYDAACAVCMVEGRGSIVVLPATDVCKNSSWTKEYNGYLMTGYTCVDMKMHGHGASGRPTRVAFLRHEVSSNVNEFYQDNNALNCVVCSM